MNECSQSLRLCELALLLLPLEDTLDGRRPSLSRLLLRLLLLRIHLLFIFQAGWLADRQANRLEDWQAI